MNLKPMTVSFRYTIPQITDFITKNTAVLRNYKDGSIDDVLSKLFLKVDYFTDGKPYKLRDITGRYKTSTRKPYVFPVSYIISKDSRAYANG